MDSIEADYAVAIMELEETRSREQNITLVEELQLQGEDINGLKHELEARENFKIGDKLTLYDQLMVSSNLSVDFIARKINN